MDILGLHKHLILTEHSEQAVAHILIASAIINIFALAAPVASIVVFNKVLPHQGISTLTLVAVGMTIVYLFEGSLRVARNIIATYLGARLDLALSRSMAQHLLLLPIRKFETISPNKLHEQLRQLDQLRGFLTSDIPVLLVDFLFSAIGLIVLLAIEWRIGLFAVGMAILFVAVSFIVDGRQRLVVQEQLDATTARGVVLGEIIQGFLTVKALNLQGLMQERYDQKLADASWANFKSQQISGYLSAVSNGLHNFASLIVLTWGAGMILRGQLTIGALVACSIIVGRTLAPLRYLAIGWHRCREASQSLSVFRQMMSEAKDVEVGLGISSIERQQPLICDGAKFVIDEGGRTILTGIDLVLTPGSVTGLVGASGSGKTTLGKLLAGLYAPSGGAVKIGRTSISQLPASVVRQYCGYVSDDAFLFSGTVLDNLLLGLPHGVTERAIQAAQFSGAHRFISQLPHGYNTRLGDGGIALSAGQRQLIAITRVLARKPIIMILDEATAALDPASEAHLLGNLKMAAKSFGLIVLIITHRYSTLSYCDRVSHLHDGQISFDGTPQEFAQSRSFEGQSSLQGSRS